MHLNDNEKKNTNDLAAASRKQHHGHGIGARRLHTDQSAGAQPIS